MASSKLPFARFIAAALCIVISAAAISGPIKNAAPRPAKLAGAPGADRSDHDPTDPPDPSPVSEPKYFDQGLLVRSGETIQALGPNLMGDMINDYTGGLSFSQADVSLPGNSALPVGVSRRLVTGTRQAAMKHGLFGDWDLELPHLRSLALQAKPDWYGGDGYNQPYNQSRCSQLEVPPSTPYTYSGRTLSHYPDSWWDGHQLVVPGGGSQTLLRRVSQPLNTIQPTDGASYPVLTKGHWQFSCLPALARGSGEGFVGRAPDGTRYQFDHMVQRNYPEYKPHPTGGGVARIEFLILPTLITDRFGNWVRYTYGGADGWRITSITSSDGRTITFGYNGWGNRIQSVNDGTRTWTYGYDGSGALQTVTLPDNSQWTFGLSDLEREPTHAPDRSCGIVSHYQWDYAYHGGTIIHPSGAQGQFTVKMTEHGRTLVPGTEEGCEGLPAPGNMANLVSRFFNNYALVNKTLSGPGMPAMSWNYEYLPSAGAFSSDFPYPGSKVIKITDPHNNIVQKTFGTGFGLNEGLLLTNVVFAGNQDVLQTTNYSYANPNDGPFTNYLGWTTTRSDVMSTIYTPQSQRAITQQGVTMTQTVTGFDVYARPRGVRRYSTLGFDRTESTAYNDNLGLWVLGQVASRTIANEVASFTEYNPATALPLWSKKFDKLQATYGFHPDGTLASITDGLNHATSFSDYMRGLPRRITYADSKFVTADVNNIGAVTRVTNEANTTWTYGYDAMGRLALKTPPAGDGVSYHPTTLTFEPVFGNEFDLEPGHWRQTITTGNAVTVNYFDARWRKRVSATYDAADRPATTRVQRFDYDAYNKTTFASYPLSGLASIYSAVPGTATTYDALGRPTLTTAASELGLLSTTTDYLSGFITRTTNPRGLATAQAFQVFDAPSQDHLITAWLPEGVTVNIQRDLLGAPLSVTRNGGGKSVTRRYVYDFYRQLCKTVEPETGATLQDYDDAGNVMWRASGQSLPGPGCETTVPESVKINYGYDLRNRLTSTSYGDGSPGITRDYSADGLLQQIASNGSAWNYTYNKRRLLTNEEMVLGGSTYALSWDFDAYGHVASLTYPDATTVQYAPNALGQPTQVSGFASSVAYYPNGAIAGYTLSNGVVHRMQQNLRQLPADWQDGDIVHDVYEYDENGNVRSIADLAQGAQHTSTSRTMAPYDGLDRLTQVSGAWGTASYSYDALDNMVTSTLGQRSLTHGYDAANRLTSLSGSQSVGLSYDANGNVTGRGAQIYAFDLGNRLRSAQGLAQYDYDGHGRRTRVSYADGTSRVFLYGQAGQLFYEARSSGVATRHIYLGGKRIAESYSGNRTPTFVYTDALGSTVAIKSANHRLPEQSVYEPYGATAAGFNRNGPGFTGHVNDPDTGLVYMQQRYYDPVAGRFLSVDPVTTDGDIGGHFGRYHYANNNPYRYIDADGQAPSSGGGFGFGWESGSCEAGSCASSSAAPPAAAAGAPSRGASPGGGTASQSGEGTIAKWLRNSVDAAKGDGLAGAIEKTVAGLPAGGAAIGAIGKLGLAAASAKELNQIAHVFPRAEKGLEGLVRASGSELNALRGIQAAANQALTEGRIAVGANGILSGNGLGAVLNVNGVNVQLIGGRVVNGAVELGSFVGVK